MCDPARGWSPHQTAEPPTGRGRHLLVFPAVPPKHYLSRFERDRGAEHAPGTSIQKLNMADPVSTPRSSTVTLSERLATPPAHVGSVNAIERWANALPTSDRDAVLNAASSPDWKHTELQEVLEAEGAPKVATSTLGRWRKTHGWSK